MSNSRENLKKSLNHKNPEQILFDLGGNMVFNQVNLNDAWIYRNQITLLISKTKKGRPCFRTKRHWIFLKNPTTTA